MKIQSRFAMVKRHTVACSPTDLINLANNSVIIISIYKQIVASSLCDLMGLREVLSCLIHDSRIQPRRPVSEDCLGGRIKLCCACVGEPPLSSRMKTLRPVLGSYLVCRMKACRPV